MCFPLILTLMQRYLLFLGDVNNYFLLKFRKSLHYLPLCLHEPQSLGLIS